MADDEQTYYTTTMGKARQTLVSLEEQGVEIKHIWLHPVWEQTDTFTNYDDKYTLWFRKGGPFPNEIWFGEQPPW